ncbi:MAG: thioredoxin family protein [bacterium]|nr:thiol reductase thioredoxin [Deltaproteobacteria bacterium]MCP4905242.1 thioredoxin family protein [bacterium]
MPSGLVAFVKRDCPTCEVVAPVLVALAEGLAALPEPVGLTVYTQDDPAFPANVERVDDRDLSVSWHHEIEAVPTLIRVESGREVERVLGWHREEWEAISGVEGLGEGLPDFRPGCGSLSVDPAHAPQLAIRFSGSKLKARRVEVASLEDEQEAFFDRGFTDGLPIVPPTEARVLAMLEGTTRSPDEMVAIVPPDLAPCSVEKVAINAVMAGCKPEYLPIVLTAVEAACTDEFNIHGLLATTMSAGPVLVVNGPIRKRIGMNSGKNVFGQGNRANSTIGRALQLVIRNVGGGRPGEVDRATLGNPGKVGFCFAEDEEGSPWTPLSTSFGHEAGVDTVMLFPGEGPRTIVDQLAREPEPLVQAFAAAMKTMLTPKMVLAFDVILVVSPEHSRIFREAGWSREDLLAKLHEVTLMNGDDLVRGAGGIADGLPEAVRGQQIPKFKPGGIHIVHAGGGAGLFSAIIPGWANGELGSAALCREITS